MLQIQHKINPNDYPGLVEISQWDVYVWNPIRLHETWNKPERVEQWRAKLSQMEDFEE